MFDPNRQNNFDLLRFVAATLVLVDHTYALTRRPAPPSPFSYETLGSFALAIFFIISGFLVASSWERTPRLRTYGRKRALRIVPAYAAVVTVCALVLGPAFTELSLADYFRNGQTWTYFRNLMFVQVHYELPGVFTTNPFPYAVNGSIWTLPIEVAMYVVVAALGCCRMLTRVGISIVVAGLGIGWFVWGPQLWAARPLFAAALPTGYTVHLALWFFTGSAYWIWRDRIRYRADIAAALFALCWVLQATTMGALALHVALPYFVVWIAQLDARWMSRFGTHGDFSYGMYLWAFPVQQALAHSVGAAWPVSAYMLVCFAVTLACAAVSWHAVEHPALRRKGVRAVG